MGIQWILLGIAVVATLIVFAVRRASRKAAEWREANKIEPERLASIARPAIAIGRGDSVFSRIGGMPNLPQTHPWPLDKEGRPLSFLCQIAFDDLPALALDLGFPARGVAFFFYCQGQSAWGFDPGDAPKWRVIYLPETPSAENRTAPDGLKPKSIFTSASVGFSVIKTYPDLKDAHLEALGIEEEAYWVFQDSQQRKSALHMMGGCPDEIQQPMEDECELASSGIYAGGAKAYKSAEAVALLQRPRDWRLLLQLDSDDDIRMNWGDGGRLYFWIRGADLAEKDFSKVWMVLQCH